MKFKRALLIFLALTFIVDISIFSAAYFYNKLVPARYLYVMYIAFAIISIASWSTVKVHIIKKLLLIGIFFVLGAVSSYIFLISTMFLPGSKEHNYVMYSVCLPALRKHYQSKGKIYSLVNVPNNKGWEEHELCEQNVWSGKEPLAGIQ
jgi:hypothetical protein